jgi:hypothetical protein
MQPDAPKDVGLRFDVRISHPPQQRVAQSLAF